MQNVPLSESCDKVKKLYANEQQISWATTTRSEDYVSSAGKTGQSSAAISLFYMILLRVEKKLSSVLVSLIDTLIFCVDRYMMQWAV